jgi:uncharacterized membrane protein YczE
MIGHLAHYGKGHDRDHGPMVLTRRLAQLYGGLCLYGFSSALIVIADLGSNRWNVFHQGLARQTAIGIGVWANIVGVSLLVLWVPLRQRPGLGTVSNALLVGTAIEVTVDHVARPSGLIDRSGMLVAGVALNGLATGLYIGARFGPGPRDGLMMGLAQMGVPLRVARTGIELTVLTLGAVLGGRVGIGTVVYALGIGPLAHFFVPRLTVPGPRSDARSPRVAARPRASGSRGSSPARRPYTSRRARRASLTSRRTGR